MLNLISTSDKLQLVTGAASADTTARVDYMEATVASGVVTPDTFKPGNQSTAAITTATTTDILGTPASDRVRSVQGIVVRNVHASASQPVTVQAVDAARTVTIFKGTLLAGETLIINEQGTAFVLDATGYVKAGGSAASSTVAGLVELADAAEMEAGSDTTRAVTPGLQHRHPGHPKAWGRANGAGTSLDANYGISSITDTGAGLITFNYATNFSAATGYAVTCSCERAATSLAVTDIKNVEIRNAGFATSSTLIECWDDTATNHVQEDPTSYHMQATGDQ